MSLLTNEVEVTIILSDGLEPIVLSFPATPLVVDPTAGKAVARLAIVSNLNTVPVAFVTAHFQHRAGSAQVIAEINPAKATIDPSDTEIVLDFVLTQNPGEVTVKGGLAIEFGKVA